MLRILAFLPILLTLSVQASAQDPRMGWDKEYGKVSGWSIGFNSKRGHCLAAATYNGGMVFFMGVDNVRKNGVIGFFNKRWSNITDGNTYKIRCRFGRRSLRWPTFGGMER